MSKSCGRTKARIATGRTAADDRLLMTEREVGSGDRPVDRAEETIEVVVPGMPARKLHHPVVREHVAARRDGDAARPRLRGRSRRECGERTDAHQACSGRPAARVRQETAASPDQ